MRLQAEVLESALALVERGGAFDDGRASLLGYRFLERDLRFGVERSYRSSPGGREPVRSASSWSIAQTKFDRGRGHDDREN